MFSIWSGGRRRKGWKFGIKAFMFPSDCYVWWSPAFLGVPEHLPALWSGELISWFVLPVHGAFVYLIICLYLSPLGFFAFYCSNSLLPPARREWTSSYMGLSCQLGLNHDTDAPHLASPSTRVLLITIKFKNPSLITFRLMSTDELFGKWETKPGLGPSLKPEDKAMFTKNISCKELSRISHEKWAKSRKRQTKCLGCSNHTWESPGAIYPCSEACHFTCWRMSPVFFCLLWSGTWYNLYFFIIAFKNRNCTFCLAQRLCCVVRWIIIASLGFFLLPYTALLFRMCPASTAVPRGDCSLLAPMELLQGIATSDCSFSKGTGASHVHKVKGQWWNQQCWHRNCAFYNRHLNVLIQALRCLWIASTFILFYAFFWYEVMQKHNTGIN